ncbi:MAG: sulfatase [Armatimonadetes bacterium]|nr:sulfatase [Armatimonadota bacterium]
MQPNVIVLIIDSLRYDHCGCYGAEKSYTPNLDAIARECAVFENAYPEALPTIPIRTSLMTGQRTLSYRPWQPLTKEDVTAAELLDELGYTSAFITDNYHQFKPGFNFHRGFHVFRWVRGQEADAYESAPHPWNIDDFIKPEMKGDWVVKMIEQYLRNRADWQTEEDWFTPRLVKESIRWLERNRRNQPFMLWFDCFDPHEPWDPPGPYKSKYTDPAYKGPDLIHPKYGPVDWLTDEELNYIRGLYAGEVEFVDKWIGILLDRIRELGLLDNSIVFLLADHGHPHGDHGNLLKTPDNLYSELIRIPFMVRHPEGAGSGSRFDALLQTHDFLPTLLDMIGKPQESTSMHGQSAWPVVTGAKTTLRDTIITGYRESGYRCVRNKEWSYLRTEGDKPDELYHLAEDPGETKNVVEQYPDIAADLAAPLGKYYQMQRQKIATVHLQLKYEVADTPSGVG